MSDPDIQILFLWMRRANGAPARGHDLVALLGGDGPSFWHACVLIEDAARAGWIEQPAYDPKGKVVPVHFAWVATPKAPIWEKPC